MEKRLESFFVSLKIKSLAAHKKAFIYSYIQSVICLKESSCPKRLNGARRKREERVERMLDYAKLTACRSDGGTPAGEV